MNYKLTSTYIHISERQGLIENNSTGVVQFAIVVQGQDPNQCNDTKVLNSEGKLVYRLKENEVMYGRSVNRLVAEVNVLYIPNDNYGDGNIDGIIEELRKEIPHKLSDLENDITMTEKQAIDIINKYK